jgi:hypothetical protein
MIDKTYQPSEVEGRIYAEWERAAAFRAGRAERAAAQPYSIVIPPPNVTGSLHMGHALNNTLQDILVRFQRMRGSDVLWQPGTDHAGIATQMVPEARGTSVALFASVYFLGQTTGVALGAPVMDRFGAQPLFVISALVLPALAFWFTRRLKRR